ncbi:MAG: hypothetical protein ACI9EK_002062 [Psychroserpens sp.]|jgi:hypothetical protein
MEFNEKERKRIKLSLIEKWLLLQIKRTLTPTVDELYKIAIVLINPFISKRSISNFSQRQKFSSKSPSLLDSSAKDNDYPLSLFKQDLGKIFISKYKINSTTLFIAIERTSGWIYFKAVNQTSKVSNVFRESLCKDKVLKIKKITGGENSDDMDRASNVFCESLCKDIPFKITGITGPTNCEDIHSTLKKVKVIDEGVKFISIKEEGLSTKGKKLKLYNNEGLLEDIDNLLNIYNETNSIKALNYLPPNKTLNRYYELSPELFNKKPSNKPKVFIEEHSAEFYYSKLTPIMFQFIKSPYQITLNDESSAIKGRQKKHLDNSILSAIFFSIKHTSKLRMPEINYVLNLAQSLPKPNIFNWPKVTPKLVEKLNSLYNEVSKYKPKHLELMINPPDVPCDSPGHFELYFFELSTANKFNKKLFLLFSIDKFSSFIQGQIEYQKTSKTTTIIKFIKKLEKKIKVQSVTTDAGLEFCRKGIKFEDRENFLLNYKKFNNLFSQKTYLTDTWSVKKMSGIYKSIKYIQKSKTFNFPQKTLDRLAEHEISSKSLYSFIDCYHPVTAYCEDNGIKHNLRGVNTGTIEGKSLRSLNLILPEELKKTLQSTTPLELNNCLRQYVEKFNNAKLKSLPNYDKKRGLLSAKSLFYQK